MNGILNDKEYDLFIGYVLTFSIVSAICIYEYSFHYYKQDEAFIKLLREFFFSKEKIFNLKNLLLLDSIADLLLIVSHIDLCGHQASQSDQLDRIQDRWRFGRLSR